jgi:nucleoid DNA-binding protein
MDKTEIIREVHQKHDGKLSVEDIEKCFDSIFNVIADSLQNNEHIQLAD